MPITFRSLVIHGSLVVLTFLTVTLAGVQWMNLNPFALEHFVMGLPYGVLITGFLFSHEQQFDLWILGGRITSCDEGLILVPRSDLLLEE